MKQFELFDKITTDGSITLMELFSSMKRNHQHLALDLEAGKSIWILNLKRK